MKGDSVTKMPISEDTFICFSEARAAHYLGLTEKQLLQAADLGHFPVYRDRDGQRIYRLDDLDRFMHSLLLWNWDDPRKKPTAPTPIT